MLDANLTAQLTTHLQNLRMPVELVASLGLTSIAEGVEDEARLDLLTVLGCEYAQGYHIAKPMPLDELSKLLREGVERKAA